MSDLGSKAALQADIDAKVTSNGNGENTGTRVRAALTNMVDTLSSAGNLSPAPFIYVTAGSNATGVYQKVGTANGKNWYRKAGASGPADPDNPTSAVIYIDGWYVTDANTDPLYFSASDVATPDLATGWDNTPPSLTGEAPLPSIAGYPGPTVQDVLEQIAAKLPKEQRIRFTVTQSGSDAPEMVVVSNTMGSLGAWSRVSDGAYRYTKTGAFASGKTWWNQSSGNLTGGSYTYFFYRISDDAMQLDTLDSGDPSDEILAEPLLLEIVTT